MRKILLMLLVSVGIHAESLEYTCKNLGSDFTFTVEDKQTVKMQIQGEDTLGKWAKNSKDRDGKTIRHYRFFSKKNVWLEASEDFSTVTVVFNEGTYDRFAVSSYCEKNDKPTLIVCNAEHAKRFGELLLEDNNGKIRSLNSYASDLIEYISGTKMLDGLTPMQHLVGMILQPELYQELPMIKLDHPKIATTLDLPEGKEYARFIDFFEGSNYKIYDTVIMLNRIDRSRLSEYEKALLDTDSKLNSFFEIVQGTALKIFPHPDEPQGKMYTILEAIKTFPMKESDKVKELVTEYFSACTESPKEERTKKADLALDKLIAYQKKSIKIETPEQFGTSSAEHLRFIKSQNFLGCNDNNIGTLLKDYNFSNWKVVLNSDKTAQVTVDGFHTYFDRMEHVSFLFHSDAANNTFSYRLLDSNNKHVQQIEFLLVASMCEHSSKKHQ